MNMRTAAVRACLVVGLCGAAQTVAHACPICFQIQDAQTIDGVRAAVGILMGATVVVLGGFGFFALRFLRK